MRHPGPGEHVGGGDCRIHTGRGQRRGACGCAGRRTRTATVQVAPGARLRPVQVSPVTVNAVAPVSVSVSAPVAVPPELASVNVREIACPTPTCP